VRQRSIDVSKEPTAVPDFIAEEKATRKNEGYSLTLKIEIASSF
jgi:hypothetical protein